MPVPNRIAALAPEMLAWRRDLHAHPELGFEEVRTGGIVAGLLASWGIEVHRGLAKTGVIGTLRNGEGPSIGLRADMDALPMQEANGFEHRSTFDGKKHGCGHDGHTATLLGAAKYLAETRNFTGTVHFIFQPAEEGGGGGGIMVRDGLFDLFPCDSVYALHNDPSVPLGEAVVVPGTILAASDRVAITVTGVGGHAARPHAGIDPVLVGSHIVVALQAIAARRIDPLDSAVISITQFHAGSAGNVIPGTAELSGTVRSLRPETQDLLERLVTQVAEGTAAAHGATAAVRYGRGYPPTVNHAEETRRAAQAAARVLGEARVVRDAPPVMGGEDFSFMLLARPGCMIKLGQREATAGGVPLHHPEYDFNDAMAPLGAGWFATLVEQELPRQG